jgi:hypothetical protein
VEAEADWGRMYERFCLLTSQESQLEPKTGTVHRHDSAQFVIFKGTVAHEINRTIVDMTEGSGPQGTIGASLEIFHVLLIFQFSTSRTQRRMMNL